MFLVFLSRQSNLLATYSMYPVLYPNRKPI